MKIEYRKADITDAELLIDIYNFAFYSDYIKYGECPAYGKTKEMMVGAWLIGFWATPLYHKPWKQYDSQRHGYDTEQGSKYI